VIRGQAFADQGVVGMTPFYLCVGVFIGTTTSQAFTRTVCVAKIEPMPMPILCARSRWHRQAHRARTLVASVVSLAGG